MSNDDDTYIDRKFEEYEERLRELERQVEALQDRLLYCEENNGKI